MSMTLLALVGIAVFIPDRINVTVGGVSIGLWVVAGAYFLGLWLVFFDQQFTAKQVRQKAKPAGLRAELLKLLVGYLISAGLILVSAPMLARSANQLTELAGLGNTFFGTVFLPLCATLPELVAGLTALRMAAFPAHHRQRLRHYRFQPAPVGAH